MTLVFLNAVSGLEVMDERSLKILALLVIIVGLPALHYLSVTANIPRADSASVQLAQDGDTFVIEGVVREVDAQGSLTRLVVSAPVDVVAFKNVSIHAGERVRVVGERDEYRDNVQLIAQEIKKV